MLSSIVQRSDPLVRAHYRRTCMCAADRVRWPGLRCGGAAWRARGCMRV